MAQYQLSTIPDIGIGSLKKDGANQGQD